MNNLLHWFWDYVHAIISHIHPLVHRRPPANFVSNEDNGTHVILIPGMYEPWNFMRSIGNSLSDAGYSVHVVDGIGYNRKAIEHESEKLRDYIDKRSLSNVVLIGHSKGWLVGKHYLAHHNQRGRAVKLIAVATPFSGSRIAGIPAGRAVKEFRPESPVIRSLQRSSGTNKMVVSAYPEFDNHVWHKHGSFLKGAKNIQIKAKGHHKVLNSKKLLEVIMRECSLPG